VAALEALRVASGSDCVALVHFDEGGAKLARSILACHPDARVDLDPLAGVELAAFPWLSSRLEALRVTDYGNTAEAAASGRTEAARFADLGLRSAAVMVLHMQGRPAALLLLGRCIVVEPLGYDVRLLMKLIGSSIASGLERLALKERVVELGERAELLDAASNEGLWDFDFETKQLYVSDRWKAMMGYS